LILNDDSIWNRWISIDGWVSWWRSVSQLPGGELGRHCGLGPLRVPHHIFLVYDFLFCKFPCLIYYFLLFNFNLFFILFIIIFILCYLLSFIHLFVVTCYSFCSVFNLYIIMTNKKLIFNTRHGKLQVLSCT